MKAQNPQVAEHDTKTRKFKTSGKMSKVGRNTDYNNIHFLISLARKLQNRDKRCKKQHRNWIRKGTDGGNDKNKNKTMS